MEKTIDVRQVVLNFFEQEVPAILKSQPELRQELKDIIQFSVNGENGGEWFIDTATGSAVRGKHENATCTIVAAAEKFAHLLDGPTSGWIGAYLNGDVKLQGNLVRALRIRKLFEKYAS